MISPPQTLIARLTTLLPGARLTTPATIDAASAAPGAYALLAHLPTHLPTVRNLAIRAQNWPLPPGWYIYAGSARGPGGMRARLRHHFRPAKTPHWHIDRLTLPADSLLALTLASGDERAAERAAECAIVTRLTASGYFKNILPGFGSSDCRTCPSHLLMPTKQPV